jgi:hypothetical protein
MRGDMSRVIVERPRKGGHGFRKGRALQEDEMPSHEGMRSPYRHTWEYKELNEYLSPLWRFLQSRVGQPWNAVWSEISAHIRSDNAVQQHVRDHVKMWVCTATRLDERGEIELLDRAYGRQLEQSHIDFYVHPVDGLLCVNNAKTSWKKLYQQNKQAQEAEWHANNKITSDGARITCHEGIWYEIELRPIPGPTPVTTTDIFGRERVDYRPVPVYDVLLKRTLYQTHGEYAVSKRQLSRSELKRAGVSNG